MEVKIKLYRHLGHSQWSLYKGGLWTQVVFKAVSL